MEASALEAPVDLAAVRGRLSVFWRWVAAAPAAEAKQLLAAPWPVVLAGAAGPD